MLASWLKTLLPCMQLKQASYKITNLGFKLHYQLTASLLLLSVLLVGAREQFGENIACFGSTEEGHFMKFVEKYCFSKSSYSVQKENDMHKNYAYPGMGPQDYPERDGDVPGNKFFQKVPLLLLVQAICFYLPYYIWKKKEGGKIKALVESLQHVAENDDQKMGFVKENILRRQATNRCWSTWLVAMEVTNLAHIIIQMWIVDCFLSGTFLKLGADVVFRFEEWKTAKISPLVALFPKVTKCTVHSYGPSGTFRLHDVACAMPLNAVYERVFTVMWFWLFGLFLVSLAVVIWRVASYFLSRHWLRFSGLMFNIATSDKLDHNQVARVVKDYQFGDWLFLYYLAKNIDGVTFSELLKVAAEELNSQELMNCHGCELQSESELLKDFIM